MKYLHYDECNKDLRDEIKELLAQPEHKEDPVAWMHIDGDSCCTNNTKLYGGVDKGYSIPLYMSPPVRDPLSDVEVLKIAIKIAGDIGIEHDPTDFEGTGVFELARAVEKAHGITGGEE